MSIEMSPAPETPAAELPDKSWAEVPDTLEQADGQPQSTTSDTTVLITQTEVHFSTAAATGLRRKDRGWITVLRRLFLASSSGSRPKPRHYPPRMDFMEDSRMSREMLRL